MKITNLEVKNFMSIGQAHLDLSNKGLVLIQGVNNDDSSASSNGAGKCLHYATVLQDALTGERDTIKNWTERTEKGEKLFVWGVDDDLKMRPTEVVDAFSTGKKEVLRVHLSNGNYVDMSKTHPVVSEFGQKKASQLGVGEFVQAPRHLKALSPKGAVSKSDLTLIAAMMADGCLRDYGYSFTNPDQEIIKLVDDAVRLRGLMLVNYPTKSKKDGLQWSFKSILDKTSAVQKQAKMELKNRFGCFGSDSRSGQEICKLVSSFKDKELLYKAYPNAALRHFFGTLGLHGKKSIQKRMPNVIYSLPDEDIRWFIKMFWSCDGYISKEVANFEVSLCLASKGLVEDFKALLLRFGIRTRIRHKKIQYGKFNAWVITPTGRDSVENLLNLLSDMPSDFKRRRVHLLQNIVANREINENIDLIPASIAGDMVLKMAANCNMPITCTAMKLTRSKSQLKSHSSTRSLLGRYADHFDSPTIRELAESDLTWLKVERIESIGLHETYDITVNNVTHLYAIDNLVTHNSSIVSSILWCLYGQTASGERTDNVVNVSADKGDYCSVSVTLEEGKDAYVITRNRARTPKKGLPFLTVEHNGKDITNGNATLNNKLVEKIVGCSMDVFTASVYAAQDGMIDLPSTTDKHLKLIVEEAAGTEKLEKALTVARKRLNSVESNQSRQLKVIDSQRELIDQLEGVKIEIAEKSSDWQQFQLNKIAQREKELASVREQLNQVLTEEMSNKKRNDENKVRRTEIAKAIISESKAHDDAQSKLTDEYHSKDRTLTQIKTKLSACVSATKKSKAALANIDNVVGTACSECGKEYEAGDLAGAKAASAKKLQEQAEELRQLSAEKKQQEAIVEEVMTRISAHRQSAPDVSKLIAEREQLEREISAYSVIQQRSSDLSSNVDRMDKELKSVMAEKNPHDVTATVKRIQTAQSKLDAAKTQIKAIEQELVVAKKAVEVYSTSGVRAHILDTVTPFLNDRTRHYLDHLSDGNITATWSTLAKKADGDLTEKFNISVTSNGASKTYKGLSGGEKRKVRLACFLSLQDLVSSRASKAIELAICDEIDDALDPSGLERLMGVLDEKARTHGTMLIITHNDLKDWVREVATIEKTNGRATVSGALCVK